MASITEETSWSREEASEHVFAWTDDADKVNGGAKFPIDGGSSQASLLASSSEVIEAEGDGGSFSKNVEEHNKGEIESIATVQSNSSTRLVITSQSHAGEVVSEAGTPAQMTGYEDLGEKSIRDGKDLPRQLWHFQASIPQLLHQPMNVREGGRGQFFWVCF